LLGGEPCCYYYYYYFSRRIERPNEKWWAYRFPNEVCVATWTWRNGKEIRQWKNKASITGARVESIVSLAKAVCVDARPAYGDVVWLDELL
jgi:hypothetical protein